MASRMRSPVVSRKTLPLTERDERALALLRSSAEQLDALSRLSGGGALTPDASESVLLHAVLEAGLAAVRAATQDVGYAQMAAQLADESAERHADARRRRPSWADEE